MNKSILSTAIVGLTLLAGCSDPGTGTTEKGAGSIVSSKSESPNPALTHIPNGHWLVNNSHCENILDARGLSDFVIDDDTIITVGVTHSGKWEPARDKDVITTVLNALKTDSGNCYNVKPEELVYLAYTSPSLRYTFAMAPDLHILFRVRGNQVDLVVPFNLEELRKTTISDPFKSEELPYDPFTD